MELDLTVNRLRLTSTGVSLYMLSHELKPDDPDPWYDQPSPNNPAVSLRREFVDLKQDLELLENGWVPPPEFLLERPFLDLWEVREAPLVKGGWLLVGLLQEASDELPDFEPMSQMGTMQIMAACPDLTWVRDRRGFYELGDPAPKTEEEYRQLMASRE